MRILLACEVSQVVTIELRKLGHEAYSCDIKQCTGGYPQWHLQQDVRPLLKEKWDMVIAFPPCTYLTVSGARWLYEQEGRVEKQKQAIDFFMQCIHANGRFVAVENPVGIMSSRYRKPDQIINPYQFGHPVEKKTCLWLKNLPNLKSTKIVKPPAKKIFKSGRTMSQWGVETWNLPKEKRAEVRSQTFPGVAKAMADQWTNFRIKPLFYV